jgi:DNA polymerase-3 subunit gamma/tau
MDQAIASAPLEGGRPLLSASQIRELMGAVPNAVFERLLEAVAAGQSAELMEQLNVLVNAGHSPSSLARQMVRYLRNTLMAKIGGEQTELLQISADERARAARSAMLFSEEEITRNLQIVLRTFDDLNYRQEQRFHLELGLLKLIHAQRLLPIEELLSGAASASGARGAAPQSTARPAAPARPPAASAPVAPPAATPISPFSSDGWNSTPSAKQSAAASPVIEMERPTPAPPRAKETKTSTQADAPQFPAVSASALGFASTTLTEGSLAKAPEAETQSPAPTGAAPSVETLRHAVGTILTKEGHASAAQLLGGASWILDGASLRIEVPGVGKKMLSLTVNATAEKIIRQELQRLGAPTRFMVLPGEGVAQAPVDTPAAGSIQESALAHPLVQRAKEIFKAEVRSVVDLRQK